MKTSTFTIIFATVPFLFTVACQKDKGASNVNATPLIGEEFITEGDGGDSGSGSGGSGGTSATKVYNGNFAMGGSLNLSSSGGLSLTSSSNTYRVVAKQLGRGSNSASGAALSTDGSDEIKTVVAPVASNGSYEFTGLAAGAPYILELDKKVTGQGNVETWETIAAIPIGIKNESNTDRQTSIWSPGGKLDIDIRYDGTVAVADVDPNSTGFTAEKLPKAEVSLGGRYDVKAVDDVGRGKAAAEVENLLPKRIFIAAKDGKADVWSSAARHSQCVDSSGQLQFSANIGGTSKVSLSFSSQSALESSLENTYSSLASDAKDRVDTVVDDNNPWAKQMCDWEPTVSGCKLVEEPTMTCGEWGCYVSSWPSTNDFDSIPALNSSLSVVERTCRTWTNEWNPSKEAELNALGLSWCDWRAGKDLNHQTGLGKEDVAVYTSAGQQKTAYMLCKTNVTMSGDKNGGQTSSYESINRYEPARGASLEASVAAIADPQCTVVSAGPFAGKRQVERSQYLKLIQEVAQGGPKWGFGGQMAMEMNQGGACSRFEFPAGKSLLDCRDPEYPTDANWDTAAGRAKMDEYHKAWSAMPQVCHNKWTVQSFGLKISTSTQKFEVDTASTSVWPWLNEQQAEIICPNVLASNSNFYSTLYNYDYSTWTSTLTADAISCRDEFVAKSETDQKNAVAALGAANWKSPYEDLLCFTSDASIKSIFDDMAKKSCIPDTYQEWTQIGSSWGEVTRCVGAKNGSCFNASNEFQGSVPGLIASGQIRYPGGNAFELFSRTVSNFTQYSASGAGGGAALNLAEGGQSGGGESAGGGSAMACTLMSTKLLAGTIDASSKNARATYTAVMKQKCAAQNSAGGASTTGGKLNLGPEGGSGTPPTSGGAAGQQGQAAPDANNWESKISAQFRLDFVPN